MYYPFQYLIVFTTVMYLHHNIFSVVFYRIDLHYRIDFAKMQKMAKLKKVLSLFGYLQLI